MVNAIDDFIDEYGEQILNGLLIVAGTAVAVGLTYVTFGAGSVLGGAIIAGCISAGVDTFKQVVVEGKSFSEVNWKQVATEGVSSFVASYIMGAFKGAGKCATLLDSAIGEAYVGQGAKAVFKYFQGEKTSKSSFREGVLKDIPKNIISGVFMNIVF